MLLSLALSAFALDDAALPSFDASPSPDEVTAGGGGGGDKGGGGKSKSGKKKKGGGSGSKESGSKDSGSKEKSSDADKEDDSDDVRLFKKHKIGKWKYQAYVMPGGGVKIDTGSSDDTAAESDSSVGGSLGADVGIKFWRKKWHDNLSIGGDYMFTSTVRGYEVRLTDTLGNRQKYWGLDGGLELYYNAYKSVDVSAVTGTASDPDAAAATSEAAGTPGVAIPILVTLGPKDLYGVLGVKPAFPLGDNAVKGVSKNITYTAGIGADLGGVTGQVYYVNQHVGGQVFHSVEASVPF